MLFGGQPGGSSPFGATTQQTTQKGPPHNPNNDMEVPDTPADGISSLKFSPTNNFLVSTSWDGEVRCWEVTPSGAHGRAKTTLEQPALCCAWKNDGTTVFAGGCSKQVKAWALQTNQSQVVAQHDAPIKHVFWIEQHNMLVTGSWDKTLRYWDLRQPAPAAQQNLSERVYAMDVQGKLMVVGLADRFQWIYNLDNPTQTYAKQASPLKYQTRCIACFPNQQGYTISSIEGRVGVHHVDAKDANKNFTFKCHRDNTPQQVYAVNAMAFHPTFHTFATAGQEGGVCMWDKDSKSRLKTMELLDQPVSCMAYNANGQLLAYASSYDWGKGWEVHNPNTAKSRIFVHLMKEEEVQPRTKGGKK